MTNLAERLRQPRTGAVIAIALAVAVVAWLLLRDDNNGSGSGSSGPGTAQSASEASVQDLKDLASDVGHPVYWAGEQPGKRLELTVTDSGYIYVRYLDPDIAIGARTGALTVGTYPVADAYGGVQKSAKQPGAITGQVANGGLFVAKSKQAQNAYLAFPDARDQIEVFDPTPGAALTLVQSGAITPVS
jgi:hypothetical protein